MLTLFQLGQDSSFFNLFLEATQGDIEIVIFIKVNAGQSKSPPR